MKERKNTALFVDDEPYLQQALIAVLEAEGISCVSLSSATEALEFIEKNTISVLVTDIMMPAGASFSGVDSSESGFALVDRILKEYPYIPIICLSVIGDQKKILSLKKKGVLYLRKGETPLETAVKLIMSKISGRLSY